MMTISNRFAWTALILVISGCQPRVAVEDLPPARETVAAIGKRLGQAMDPIKLANIARDERQLLKHLTHAERDALGRSAVRFQVDRAVDVFILANVEPFWLAEQGFGPTGGPLAERGWRVSRPSSDLPRR